MSPDTALRRAREEVVLRHVAAENARDLDAAMATFTHPRYEIIPTGTVFDGDEAVRAMLLQQWVDLPMLRYAAEAIYHGDNGLVVETRTTAPGTPLDMLSVNLFASAGPISSWNVVISTGCCSLRNSSRSARPSHRQPHGPPGRRNPHRKLCRTHHLS